MATPSHDGNKETTVSSEDPIPGIEVEVVDNELFDVLDSVTDLGTLDFEYSETKKNLALRVNNGCYVPIDLFKGGSRSVSVSDISSSLWCELQIEYRYLHPHLSRTSEWVRRKNMGTPVERKTKQMKDGSAIHYEKEREIREMVEVQVITDEDKCAIDLINTAVKLQSVRDGNIEREIKLIGKLYGGDCLVTGVIDQLQYCHSDESLTILELKTRRTNSLPNNAQRQMNQLQVMLYKSLLDSMTHGVHTYTDLLALKRLRMCLPLSAGPVSYAKQTGLALLLDKQQSFDILTLKQLAEAVTMVIQGLSLPLVDSLMVQYVYQGDKEVIGVEPVEYDDDWARNCVQTAYGYWKGERDACGVDIEETSWKCSSCQFKEVCFWRKKQVMEVSPIKKWPKEFYQPSPKQT